MTPCKLLRKELASIDADGGLEIVVVDDGSSDGTGYAAEAGRGRPGDRARRSTGARARRCGRACSRPAAARWPSPTPTCRTRRTISSTCSSRSRPDGTSWSAAGATTTPRRSCGPAGCARSAGRAINLLTRVVLLGRYRDTQCGLKAFRSDLARLIFEHSHVDGFAFDVEIFHLVEAYHLSLSEVPVRVQNSSRSTVHVVRDAAVHGPRRVRRAALVGRRPLRPRAGRGRAGGPHRAPLTALRRH